MENKVVTFSPRESDKIRTHRKEKAGLYREYALLDPSDGKAVVNLRLYWPGDVCYACVWIYGGPGLRARGAGRAGGGGHCKASAAAAYALADAGVTLAHAIDGVGSEAIAGAMRALGEHLDVAGAILHVAHV